MHELQPGQTSECVRHMRVSINIAGFFGAIRIYPQWRRNHIQFYLFLHDNDRE